MGKSSLELHKECKICQALGSFPNYLYTMSWPSCCWKGFLDQQWTYGGKHERRVINC